MFLPAALPAQQQAALVAAALEDYCQPPARTNHTRLYGPLPGLWRAATERLRLNWTRRVEEPAAPQTGGALRRREGGWLGFGGLWMRPRTSAALE